MTKQSYYKGILPMNKVSLLFTLLSTKIIYNRLKIRCFYVYTLNVFVVLLTRILNYTL